MPNSLITLLIVTVVVGLVGFGGLAGAFMGIVKLLFFVLLGISVIAFVKALVNGKIGRGSPPPAPPPYRPPNRPVGR